jgi:SAM-dependent methyltransferase
MNTHGNSEPLPQDLSTVASAEAIKQAVRQRYSEVARRGTSCCGEAPATSEAAERVKQFGYELGILGDHVPDSVLESFAGCGNPLAIDALQPGQVVLDLGSGAGLDCFLAAKKVGLSGRVIGLDMTDAMLEKARANQQKLGLTNVEFRKGEMEAMPVESDSIDVIISNCVINLSPDKDRVFHEAFRVLKPGGKLMVSDIVTIGELPDELRSVEAWTGCIGGAIPVDAYLAKLRQARFADVRVIESSTWRPGVLSVKVIAVKPST